MNKNFSKNLYKIEIPLTGNPLKALNAYVIKAPDRNLIIDTGWMESEKLYECHDGGFERN